MTAVQATLSFRVRKKAKAPLAFYSSKLENGDQKSVEAIRKEHIVPVYSPKVKKLVELDSDDENIDFSNTRERRLKKRPFVNMKESDYGTETSDSDCSPTKISRMVWHSNLNTGGVLNPPIKRLSVDGVTQAECGDEMGNNNRHNARLALHTLSSTTLPGRQAELDRLQHFLTDHLDNKKSGTLYVSGPPGTGKTACLSNILQYPQFKKGFRSVYVNCTSMRSAGSVYGRICKELSLKTTGTTEKAYLKAIDKHLVSKHSMILLVLDEIDQLCNKKQSVLYTIFEWPSLPKSNMVLIGIANALDLTDRTLPRLQARGDLRPELMHFAPYTKQQIMEIFSERLKEEVALDFFSPIAIQMLAGKVAAICGDIRRALDIGRRVVELATPKTLSGKRSGTTVELKQVMEVLNDVYGASQKLEEEMDERFPLQQKLLICSLLLMLSKGKNKDITVGKLHEVYKRVCTKRNIIAVDSTEFVGLCGLVETRGIIRLSGRKEPRTHKVVLQWDESEVSNALSDKQLITDVINDISCLP